jgi:AcrR family transcriptional regulator
MAPSQNHSKAQRKEPSMAPSTLEGGTGKRLSPEQRRAQIIDITEQLFATHPYGEVGVPDVARAAGVTPGLVYHYFPTKEALFIAASELRANELLRFCQPSPGLALEEQVLQGVRGYLAFVDAHGRAYLNLFQGPAAADEGFVQVCERTRQLLIDFVVVGLGATDPARPVALRLALRGYIGFAESTILSWLPRRQVPRETLERLLLAAILSAIRIGLASEADPPMSPEDAAKLEGRSRKRFGLP